MAILAVHPLEPSSSIVLGGNYEIEWHHTTNCMPAHLLPREHDSVH